MKRSVTALQAPVRHTQRSSPVAGKDVSTLQSSRFSGGAHLEWLRRV